MEESFKASSGRSTTTSLVKYAPTDLRVHRLPGRLIHSWADTLKWNGHSGDYGPNFSSHSMGIRMYLIEHPDFGLQAFGGTVTSPLPRLCRYKSKILAVHCTDCRDVETGRWGVHHNPVGSGAAAPGRRMED
ncbi:hypothetical protein EV421DRAFT_1803881 [Armillaria borealis]|uniref:Uncharacterized protein n=1 Tax=Armillaria borealis TaxID=47425 RepID=A0AA39MQL4_9AGAR|nr:hypothetical protein EV421DRAFT_1803881 [Armillaria borealis]